MQSSHLPESHTPRTWHWLWVGLLVIWGPLYRALIDKSWMHLGGLQWVGQWAQWQGLSDLVCAPAMAGVGLGLTVLTAQKAPEQHAALWFGATGLGWLCTAPLWMIAWFFPEAVASALRLGPEAQHWVGKVALSGWTSILWGMLSSYWLGRHQQGRVALLALLTGTPQLLALASAHGSPPEIGLQRMVLTSLFMGLVGVLAWLALWIRWVRHTPGAWTRMQQVLSPVASYLPAGFSVGLLTPLSVLIIRSHLAQHMDWDAAGIATALWRASDWVLSGASGVLYFHYLPRLSLAAQHGRLQLALGPMLKQVLGPCVLALIGLWGLQAWVLPLLYDERLSVSPFVSALFWAGDGLRVVAAVFLFGLYAQQASQAIAWGEWLSQPLLALLLVLGAAQALVWTGLAHVATYAVYASFNALALHWLWRRQTDRH